MIRVWRRAGRASSLLALALLAAVLFLTSTTTTTTQTDPPSRIALLRRALFSSRHEQALLSQSLLAEHGGGDGASLHEQSLLTHDLSPDEQSLLTHHPPPEHGKGDGPPAAPATKAIVVGRRSHEDVSWIRNELPDFEPFVYTVDDPNAPGTFHTPNKGREALPYLTHLVDNYDNLSDTIAFLHSHRGGFPQAWHVDNQDYSNVDSMRWLNASYIQATGYANLRCNPAVGCPAEMRLDHPPADPDRVAEREMPAAFAALMGPHVPVPPVVAQACCAQFAVSKAQVRRRPRADYVRYRRWLLETPLPDDVSGRIFEYMWHIIFGKDPVFCPDMESCYCNLYGACLFA